MDTTEPLGCLDWHALPILWVQAIERQLREQQQPRTTEPPPVAKRPCNKCGNLFASRGPGHRRCPKCDAAMKYVPSPRAVYPLPLGLPELTSFEHFTFAVPGGDAR
jgi:hypothetical protein